jgi:hypothetical protein
MLCLCYRHIRRAIRVVVNDTILIEIAKTIKTPNADIHV